MSVRKIGSDRKGHLCLLLQTRGKLFIYWKTFCSNDGNLSGYLSIRITDLYLKSVLYSYMLYVMKIKMSIWYDM